MSNTAAATTTHTHMNHVDIADPGMRFVAELEVLGQTVREMADPGHYSFEYRDRAKPWQLKLATLRRIYRDARQDPASPAVKRDLRHWANGSGIEGNFAMRILDCRKGRHPMTADATMRQMAADELAEAWEAVQSAFAFAMRTLRHDDDPAYSRLDAYVSQVFDPDSRMLGMQSVDAWITETIEALAPSAADGYDDYQVCGADIDHDGHRPACPVLATLCPQCGSPVTDTHPDADGCAIAHAEAVLA
jgi:hypothetical protein